MRSMMLLVMVFAAGCGGSATTTSGGTTSGGTGGTGGSGGMSTTSSAGTTGGAACDTYCTTLAANCAAGNIEYISDASCQGACAALPPGSPDDTMGNTLGCRLNYVGLAKDNPVKYCNTAGPLGNSVCGADCDGFCAIAMSVCGDQPEPPYASKADCLVACNDYLGIKFTGYNPDPPPGNNLNCRVAEALKAAASTDMAAAHCPNAGKSSAVCK